MYFIVDITLSSSVHHYACMGAFISPRLMSVSELAFAAALEARALPLLTDLTQDSSDPLLQLNALELLEQVGGMRRNSPRIPIPHTLCTPLSEQQRL